jgi:hypothetical protein
MKPLESPVIDATICVFNLESLITILGALSDDRNRLTVQDIGVIEVYAINILQSSHDNRTR